MDDKEFLHKLDGIAELIKILGDSGTLTPLESNLVKTSGLLISLINDHLEPKSG